MWWNALHPGPQKFLLELIEEVVTRYDIDGIQGDDRLPAMPLKEVMMIIRYRFSKASSIQIPQSITKRKVGFDGDLIS